MQQPPLVVQRVAPRLLVVGQPLAQPHRLVVAQLVVPRLLVAPHRLVAPLVAEKLVVADPQNKKDFNAFLFKQSRFGGAVFFGLHGCGGDPFGNVAILDKREEYAVM